MLNEKDISCLISLYEDKYKIGPEYYHDDFIFGSYDYFLDKNLRDIASHGNVKLDNLAIAIKNIKNLKSYAFSTYNDNTHISEIKIDTDFFKNLRISIISDKLDIFKTEWKNLALKVNVDITEEINNINDQLQYLNDTDLANKLYTELKYINDATQKMYKLEELNADIILDDKKYDMLPSSEKYIVRKDDKESLEKSVAFKNEYKKLNDFFNDESKIINSFNSNNIVDCLKKINFYKPFDNINIEFGKIHEKIKNQSTIIFSKAQEYVNLNNVENSSDINNFINHKFVNSYCKFTITPTKEIKELILFEDNSLFLKDNNGKCKTINNISSAKSLAAKILLSELAFKLRKNPNVLKFFNIALSEHLTYKISTANIAANTYLENENILKVNKFKIEDNFNGSFEYLDDSMNKCIRNHKIKQYAHSISSNKYEHLYNDDSYKTITELYDLKIDIKVLQDMIGKKMAAYKTPEEFNNALVKLNNSFNDFNFEAIKNKSNSIDAPIIYQNENLLVIKINDFKQSKFLGSGSWCISRDEHYFESYTEDGQQQYFIFDFSKSSKDRRSMIGITLNSYGEQNTAHFKNDEYYEMDEFLENIQLNIIINDNTPYSDIPKELSDKIKDLEQNNKLPKVLNNGNKL